MSREVLANLCELLLFEHIGGNPGGGTMLYSVYLSPP